MLRAMHRRQSARVSGDTVTGAQLFSSLPARRRAPPACAMGPGRTSSACTSIIIRRSTEQSETVSKAHTLCEADRVVWRKKDAWVHASKRRQLEAEN